MTDRRRTRLVARGYKPLTTRDSSIAFVFVATEDTYAAATYLYSLQDRGLIDQLRVQVVPLPTLDGRSTLPALLERLDALRQGPGIRLPADTYWAVFDVDKQAPATLDDATCTAGVRNIALAGNNPCFELWLALHLTEGLDGIVSGQQDRGAGRKCEALLHALLQAGDPRARGYDKSSPGPERFTTRDRVETACRRARTLSPHASTTIWPRDLGSHMHLLVGPLCENNPGRREARALAEHVHLQRRAHRSRPHTPISTAYGVSPPPLDGPHLPLGTPRGGPPPAARRQLDRHPRAKAATRRVSAACVA
jgi:hypothetical protein